MTPEGSVYVDELVPLALMKSDTYAPGLPDGIRRYSPAYEVFVKVNGVSGSTAGNPSLAKSALVPVRFNRAVGRVAKLF